MQQGIKKLQWCEYLKLVFLEILNPLLCRVFANQVTYCNKVTVPLRAFAANRSPLATKLYRRLL